MPIALSLIAIGCGGNTPKTSPDGGSGAISFVALSGPTTETLYGIWGSDPGDVFAVGAGRVIAHTQSSGESFSAQILDGNAGRFLGVAGSSTSAFVVGEAATILRSDDGMTFTAETAPPGNSDDFDAIWSGDQLFVAGSRSIVRSPDGGTTWTTEKENSESAFFGVWGLSSSDLDVVGEGGQILHFDGVSWTPQNSRTTQPLLGIWGVAGDRFAVGQDGTILHSSGDGNWTVQSSNIHDTLRAVFGFSAKDVYIVGDLGTLLHSTDAGATWNPIATSTNVNLYSIWGSADSDLYLVGELGTILHTGGGGS